MLFFLLACSKSTPGVAPVGTNDPHVLIIVLDGMRTDEFTTDTISDLTGMTGEEFAHRTWDTLLPDALTVRGALNIGLTSTDPGHAMILGGRQEPVMTVAISSSDANLYRPFRPNLYEEARAQKGWSEEEALLLANAVVMPNSTHSIAPGWGDGAVWEMLTLKDDPEEPEPDDGPLVDRLKEVIDNGPPHVLLANLHDVDREGHTGNQKEYLDRIQTQDKLISGFWEWLQENHPDYAWQTLTIITADHGRHRHDLDGGWAQHGDACTGCRDVPFFMLGRNVQPGIVEGSYTTLDIAPTMAAHLGIDLPWATGLAIGPDSAQARQGMVSLSQSNGLQATVHFLNDLEHRSEIVVDGEVVSSPEALMAEAPVVLRTTEQDYICFREIIIDQEEDAWPWVPHCLSRSPGGAWTDMGFPEDDVGPFWEPSLAIKDGNLWMSWLHTPKTRNTGDPDAAMVASFNNGVWDVETPLSIDFATTNINIAPTPRGYTLAISTNDGDPAQFNTRRITTMTFEDGRETGSRNIYLDVLDTYFRRVEKPAIIADGDHERLAMLGIDENKRGLGWMESETGGNSWDEPAWIDSDVFMHTPPQWDGEFLVWAALVDGDAALCRTNHPTTSPTCISTDSPRIDSFSVENGVATASVDIGAGEWALVNLQWE